MRPRFRPNPADVDHGVPRGFRPGGGDAGEGGTTGAAVGKDLGAGASHHGTVAFVLTPPTQRPDRGDDRHLPQTKHHPDPRSCGTCGTQH